MIVNTFRVKGNNLIVNGTKLAWVTLPDIMRYGDDTMTLEQRFQLYNANRLKELQRSESSSNIGKRSNTSILRRENTRAYNKVYREHTVVRQMFKYMPLNVENTLRNKISNNIQKVASSSGKEVTLDEFLQIINDPLNDIITDFINTYENIVYIESEDLKQEMLIYMLGNINGDTIYKSTIANLLSGAYNYFMENAVRDLSGYMRIPIPKQYIPKILEVKEQRAYIGSDDILPSDIHEFKYARATIIDDIYSTISAITWDIRSIDELDELEELIDETESTLDKMIHEGTRKCILNIVNHFKSEKLRKIMIAYLGLYGDAAIYVKDISSQLGISTTYVYTQLRRGCSILRCRARRKPLSEWLY